MGSMGGSLQSNNPGGDGPPAAAAATVAALGGGAPPPAADADDMSLIRTESNLLREELAGLVSHQLPYGSPGGGGGVDAKASSPGGGGLSPVQKDIIRLVGESLHAEASQSYCQSGKANGEPIGGGAPTGLARRHRTRLDSPCSLLCSL